MLEILTALADPSGGLVGLLGGLGGAVARFFAAKQARAAEQDRMTHELAMMDKQADIDERRARLQAEAASQASQQQLELIRANQAASSEEQEMRNWGTALATQMQATGVRWIDALNSSVRPVTTYYWCVILYGVAKACLIIALFPDATAKDIADTLVTNFDRTVIASLLGFWFVDRSLRQTNAPGR